MEDGWWLCIEFVGKKASATIHRHRHGFLNNHETAHLPLTPSWPSLHLFLGNRGPIERSSPNLVLEGFAQIDGMRPLSPNELLVFEVE
jgi:hypothetical protein